MQKKTGKVNNTDYIGEIIMKNYIAMTKRHRRYVLAEKYLVGTYPLYFVLACMIISGFNMCIYSKSCHLVV